MLESYDSTIALRSNGNQALHIGAQRKALHRSQTKLDFDRVKAVERTGGWLVEGVGITVKDV